MSQFAFFFPGQGSQSVGMMQGFAESAVVRDTFAEASEILGQDFWRMVSEPNDELNFTTNTQPLMLVAGIATWRAWMKITNRWPALMAGHSLGEFTALVAAGAISFVDALHLVRFRAEVMQSAVTEGEGAMAAILGLEDDVVSNVCSEAAHGQVLQAVNFNSPGQVVIAGQKAAVERGMESAKAKGAKRVVMLPVSVPSHCALMKPAAEELEKYLNSVTVNIPQVTVLHNADVASYSDASSIKNALVRQLYSPVRWVETVRKVADAGVKQTAECGPGKVLAGLCKRIVAEIPCHALTGIETLQEFRNLVA